MTCVNIRIYLWCELGVPVSLAVCCPVAVTRGLALLASAVLTLAYVVRVVKLFISKEEPCAVPPD